MARPNIIIAPVACLEAVRIFVAYATHKSFPIYQMDVKMTFINGPLKEEQAPRAWYDELSTFLMSKGFTKDVDHVGCLDTRKSTYEGIQFLGEKLVVHRDLLSRPTLHFTPDLLTFTGQSTTEESSLYCSGFSKGQHVREHVCKWAIGTKWIFRNKKDERGIVIRNKARLVAQGYTQEEGIDYDEVFAPVARIEAIRLFLAYASFMGFMVYKIDVKSAFLYGKIEEEQKGVILLVHVYVNDIIFGSTKKELCIEFEKLMHDKFQMSSMGKLTFFLGLQVKQKEDGIFISQDKYVADILRKFGFTDVRTASTPMDTEKPLLKDSDGNDVDIHLYRSMIGSLMYLTSSIPDIMFAVCACARFQVTPKVSHSYAVKRIFRYLKGQPKLGLWYPRDSPFDLVAYSDSDYAGASLDRKSTTGGCQFLGCRLISWQCKKQIVVATSSTKAKYVAAASCCGQVQKQVIMQVKLERRQNLSKIADPPYSQDPKNSHDDGSKSSSDNGKKVDEEPRKDSECNDQEKEDNINSTNTVNADGTNKVNVVEADINNLDTTIQVSPIPTIRIHKDHPLDQVIGDLQSATQTRKMSKNLKEHGFVRRTQKGNSCIEGSKLDRGTKWVFKNKKDERGIVIRNKARLVAQGYTQEEGIDYDEVFALVARIEAIRLFLAYASFKDFVDLKIQTFLIEYTRLKKHCIDYIKLLELHQAPRAWYETLSTYMLDNGFQRGKINKTLFIKRHKGDILLVQVYVDDIIFGSTKKELCFAFEKLMHEKFQMSSMGELTFFLGLQVKQKKDDIFISQDKYVD
ncbi:putative ribonuclease H-like domain-containing protein [Tanacetum coccineum]|uniref:Ribonuclease H-like domain-containing protein n=1 Tax=Tanacetum coccineum TaxID=301880 RepID=A0ABQ5C6C6_9ASTR